MLGKSQLFPLLLAAQLTAGIPPAALDPGGVSVDLSVFKGTPEVSGTGENLVRDGDFEDRGIDFTKTASPWRGGCHIWQNGLKDPAHRKRIAGAMQRTVVRSGVGSRCAVLHTPDEAGREQNADGDPWMNSYISQEILLPDSAVPVKYSCSFMVRGRTRNAAGANSLNVFADFFDREAGVPGAKTLRKTVNHRVTLPVNWEQRSFSFAAPPHTRRISLRFALYGQGKIFLDDVKLLKTPVPEGADIYVSPLSHLDNTCCIGENQPGVISFVMRNEGRAKFKKLTLHLKIPAGFRFHGGNFDDSLVKCVKNPDGSAAVTCIVQRFVPGMPVEGHGVWLRPAVVLIPEVKASGKRYPLIYSLSDGPWHGAEKSIELKVIEAVRGKRPKYFITGIQTAHEFSLPEDKLPVIREFLVRNGLNALHGGSDALKKEVKKAGILRFSTRHTLSNGYRLGGNANRTPESYFRQADGKPFKLGMFKTCPVEIYRRGKFYRSEVYAMLEEMVLRNDTADHIMPNWELQGTKFKGCFCDRCREEFLRHMAGKAKPEEIRAKWPRRIIADYETQWILFRSHQHAKVCQTLEADIRELGRKAGKESHFVPEIEYSQLLEGGLKTFEQYSSLDFLGKLPWIDPWGPYVFADFTEKYVYFPGLHLLSFVAGEENKLFVKRHVEDPARRPKLIAMPQGLQCGSWVTEPEAVAFDTLSYFVNAWAGSICYYFPQGYDQRYWNALAGANDIIARHEETVLKGKPTDSVRFTPVTPCPVPLFPAHHRGAGDLKKYLPSLDSRQIWQGRSWRGGDETVAALGNFWQKGELFALMHVRGLEKDGSYTVNSSEKYSLGMFSGAELEKGILVHAGALRWNFFRIVPGKAGEGEFISQAAMKAEMEKRLPRILKMAAWEKAYAEKMRSAAIADEPVNDFSSLRPLANGSVSLKAVQFKGKYQLQITLPSGTILLDPALGGAVTSLEIGGKELVREPGFGTSGFWTPRKAAHNVVKGFKVADVKKVGPDGIEIELHRNVSELEKAPLAGVRIVRRLLFTPRSLTIGSRLENTAASPRRFAFRFHMLPEHLGGPEGRAVFGGVGFDRGQGLRICRFGSPEKEIDATWRAKLLDVRGPAFTLRKPGLPDLTVTPGGAPVYGVIFWDTGTCSTAEPVFKTITLAPGAAQDFTMKVQWQK
ncbi:MAG: hypothetical protein IJT50_14700 [Lentisphaeria bacterium]|nr:hypothetical protein [Lentisphaeria bacterium]